MVEKLELQPNDHMRFTNKRFVVAGRGRGRWRRCASVRSCEGRQEREDKIKRGKSFILKLLAFFKNNS
jgi:hypothetical protein